MSWDPTYTIGSNSINIGLGTYVNTLPLIIEIDLGELLVSSDPPEDNLLWSTFLGGTYNDFAVCNTTYEDELWVGGQSQSGGFLDDNGIVTFDEYYDGYVANFNLITGKLEWITRLIGNIGSAVNEIDFNPENNHCFAVGATQSINLIDNSNVGINDIENDGGNAGFVMELTDDGFYGPNTLQSYIDGDGIGETCLAVDFQLYNNGVYDPRLFIAGRADTSLNMGSSNFPLQNLSGAYFQSTSLGLDGFIMQLDSEFNNHWCTLIATDSIDLITEIVVAEDKVLVVGETRSNVSQIGCNVPSNGGIPICITDANSYSQNTHIGEYGHFIMEFNSDLDLKWSTYVAGGDRGGTKISYVIDDGNNLDPSIYVVGSSINAGLVNTFSSSSGNYNQDSQWWQEGGYICRFIGRELVWKSYLTGIGFSPKSISAFQAKNQNDELVNGGIVIGGGTTIGTAFNQGPLPTVDSCMEPSIGSFSMCDQNNDLFSEETDNIGFAGARMALMSFDSDDNLIWSTFLGESNPTSIFDVEYTGERVLVTGIAAEYNTLIEFNDDNDIDYWRPVSEGQYDGTIAMFSAIQEEYNGIDDLNLEYDLNKYYLVPNPTSNNIRVYSSNTKKIETIRIFNSMGAMLESRKIDDVLNDLEFEVGAFATGLYFVVIIDEDNEKYILKFSKL